MEADPEIRFPKLLEVTVVSASGLIAADANGKSDPYVVVDFKRLTKPLTHRKSFSTKSIVSKEKSTDSLVIAQAGKLPSTRVKQKTLEPKWNEMLPLRITPSSKGILTFTMFDKDVLGSDDFLGYAEIPLPTDEFSNIVMQPLRRELKLGPRDNHADQEVYYQNKCNLGVLMVQVRGVGSSRYWNAIQTTTHDIIPTHITVTVIEGDDIKGNGGTAPSVDVKISGGADCKHSGKPGRDVNGTISWGDNFKVPIDSPSEEIKVELTVLRRKEFCGYAVLPITKSLIRRAVGERQRKSMALTARPDNTEDLALLHRRRGKLGIITCAFRVACKQRLKPEPEPLPEPEAEPEPEPLPEPEPELETEPEPLLLNDVPNEPHVEEPEMNASRNSEVPPALLAVEFADDRIRSDGVAPQPPAPPPPPPPKAVTPQSIPESPVASVSSRKSASRQLDAVQNQQSQPPSLPFREVTTVGTPTSQASSSIASLPRSRVSSQFRNSAKPRTVPSAVSIKSTTWLAPDDEEISKKMWEVMTKTPPERRSSARDDYSRNTPMMASVVGSNISVGRSSGRRVPPQDRERMRNRASSSVFIAEEIITIRDPVDSTTPSVRSESNSKQNYQPKKTTTPTTGGGIDAAIATEMAGLAKALKAQQEVQKQMISLSVAASPPRHRTLHVDPNTGLYYTFDPLSGNSEWLEGHSPGSPNSEHSASVAKMSSCSSPSSSSSTYANSNSPTLKRGDPISLSYLL